MKVLITGVGGLLGSKLADWIIANNLAEVYGIDDLSGGYIENINKNVNFYQKNLVYEDEFFKSFFKENKFDYVFHFAAYAAEGLSPFIRKYNYENNLIATTKLINLSIENSIKRFVFTSTMAVYGNAEIPFKESYIPAPIDPYGVAKYACEMDIKCAGEQHGMDWCIFRPHNVYGPNQNLWDKYRNVLGIWMYQLLNDQPITIYGDGNQTRSFSYIDDCLPYFWKGAVDKNASKEIFNIGGNDFICLNDASDILIDIVGKGTKKYLEERHEVKHAWVSHDKIKKLLNYKSTTNLKEGLQQMWDWAKQQPKRERKLWSSYELNKGMYSFWKN